jgi:hypothetical protein
MCVRTSVSSCKVGLGIHLFLSHKQGHCVHIHWYSMTPAEMQKMCVTSISSVKDSVLAPCSAEHMKSCDLNITKSGKALPLLLLPVLSLCTFCCHQPFHSSCIVIFKSGSLNLSATVRYQLILCILSVHLHSVESSILRGDYALILNRKLGMNLPGLRFMAMTFPA